MNLTPVKFNCDVCQKTEISYRKMVRWRKCNMCKICYMRWWRRQPENIIKQKKYLEDNKNRLNVARKAYQRLPLRRYKQSVCKAKIMKKSWNIPLENYIELISNPCFYCGEKLNETAAGLDRINNSIGYELDNVLPCCLRCNRTRSIHWTVEETKAMVSLGLSMRQKQLERLVF